MQRKPVPDIELSILRALVSRAQEAGDTRSRSIADSAGLYDELANHEWSETEHHVVYQCLRAARQPHPVPLREELAARATRMGHPDVDWDLYFRQASGEIDLVEMVRSLKQ